MFYLFRLIFVVWALSFANIVYSAEIVKDFGDGFSLYNNGTYVFRDRLMITVNATTETMKYDDARTYCENYTGGGYDDWRMPTSWELYTLPKDKVFAHSKESRIYIPSGCIHTLNPDKNYGDRTPAVSFGDKDMLKESHVPGSQTKMSTFAPEWDDQCGVLPVRDFAP